MQHESINFYPSTGPEEGDSGDLIGDQTSDPSESLQAMNPIPGKPELMGPQSSSQSGGWLGNFQKKNDHGNSPTGQ